MSYITKNYSTDGGDTLVIGGTLKVEAGATVEGLEGGGGATAWADITGKPAVIAAGADQAAARTAIGAGTSSVVVGAGATNAAAGNHNHAVTADAGSGLAAAANIQAAFVALSARVKALEDAAP
ncbi:hypothetical protein H9643_08130 [Ochrobactrum sp. Sa2BUA5]|nr:hypothetical protein [Ochrobactrum gallinarum]